MIKLPHGFKTFVFCIFERPLKTGFTVCIMLALLFHANMINLPKKAKKILKNLCREVMTINKSNHNGISLVLCQHGKPLTHVLDIWVLIYHFDVKNQSAHVLVRNNAKILGTVRSLVFKVVPNSSSSKSTMSVCGDVEGNM